MTAFWAIVAGFVLFPLGVVWERVRGPEGVVVLNPDTTARVVVVADSAQRELISNVLEEMRSLRLQSSREDRPSRALEPPAQLAAPSQAALPPIAPAFVTTYPFPASVKGYLMRDFGAFGNIRCGPSAHRPGSEAFFEVSLRTASDTSRLSPLFVRIARRQPGEGGVQLFEQRYQLSAASLVAVPMPATPGAYEVDLGVYVTSELDTTYPPFYRRTCSVRVVE